MIQVGEDEGSRKASTWQSLYRMSLLTPAEVNLHKTQLCVCARSFLNLKFILITIVIRLSALLNLRSCSPLSGRPGSSQFRFLWVTGCSWRLDSHLWNSPLELSPPCRSLQSSRNHFCRKPQACVKHQGSIEITCVSVPLPEGTNHRGALPSALPLALRFLFS